MAVYSAYMFVRPCEYMTSVCVCVRVCACVCVSLRVDAYICAVFCLLQDGCVSLSQRIWRADFALSRQMLSALSQLVWARLVAAPAAK